MDKKVQEMIDLSIKQNLAFGQGIIIAMLLGDFFDRRSPEQGEKIKRDMLAIWNKRMEDLHKADLAVLENNPNLPAEVRQAIVEASDGASAQATAMFRNLIMVYGEDKPAEGNKNGTCGI